MTAPEIDLLCERCRYDVRGLPVDSNCPECGLSIATSRSAYEVRVTINPAGRLVRIGCLMLLTWPLGFALCCCLLASSFTRGVDPWLARVAVFPWLSLWGTGLYLLTTPGPRLSRVDGVLRQVVRGCCPAPVVLGLICCFGGDNIFLVSIFLAVGIWAIPFFYLRKLARPLVGRPLSTPCLIVGIGLLAAVLCGVCWTLSPGSLAVAGGIAVVSAIVLILFSAVVLMVFLNLFAPQTIDAAERWEAKRRAVLQSL